MDDDYQSPYKFKATVSTQGSKSISSGDVSQTNIDIQPSEQHQSKDEKDFFVLFCGHNGSGKTSLIHTLSECPQSIRTLFQSPNMSPIPIYTRSGDDQTWSIRFHLMDKSDWCDHEKEILDDIMQRYVRLFDERFEKIGTFDKHHDGARLLAQMYSHINWEHYECLKELIKTSQETQANEFEFQSPRPIINPNSFAAEMCRYFYGGTWPLSLDVRSFGWNPSYSFEGLSEQELEVLLKTYVYQHHNCIELTLKLILHHLLGHPEADIETSKNIWKQILYTNYQSTNGIDEWNYAYWYEYENGCRQMQIAHKMGKTITTDASDLFHLCLFDSITSLWPLIDRLELKGPLSIPDHMVMVDLPSQKCGIFGMDMKLAHQLGKIHQILFTTSSYSEDHYNQFMSIATNFGWKKMRLVWTKVDRDAQFQRFDGVKKIKKNIRQSYGRDADSILKQLRFNFTSSKAHDASLAKNTLSIKTTMTWSPIHHWVVNECTKGRYEDVVVKLRKIGGIDKLKMDICDEKTHFGVESEPNSLEIDLLTISKKIIYDSETL